jgi:hypothetical protein
MGCIRIASGTVNNIRDWRLQCGGGGVDLRMGLRSRWTGEREKEMTDKRSLVFVGKMIGIPHSPRDSGNNIDIIRGDNLGWGQPPIPNPIPKKKKKKGK